MTNLFDLTGKVALVTGGNGGVGLGFAQALADQAVEFSKPYLITNIYVVTRKDGNIKKWEDLDKKGVKYQQIDTAPQ